jgi:hypothetical protein
VTPPEPLLLGTATIQLRDGARAEARALRLASCPGLAVTEVGSAGSWVATHEASGRRLSPFAGDDDVAPWPEAVRYMRALAALPIEWAQVRPLVHRDQLPAFGGGWLSLLRVEGRRAA